MGRAGRGTTLNCYHNAEQETSCGETNGHAQHLHRPYVVI